MNELEISKKLLGYIEANDRTSAQKLLAEDFTFSGPVPEPISGPRWLAMTEIARSMARSSLNASS